MSKNKKTTFKFPFDINPNFFLGLSLFFFIISIKPINEIIFPRITPVSLKLKIEKDIDKKVKLFNNIISNDTLIKNAYNTKSTVDEIKKLTDLPFAFYLYKDSQVVFWNSIEIIYPTDTFKEEVLTPFEEKKGNFLVYKKRLSKNKTAIALFKIKFENDLTESSIKYFPINDNENDFGINVVNKFTPKGVPVCYKNNVLFYLEKIDDFFTINDSNGWRLFLNVLPFIFFGICIHTYFKVRINKNNKVSIFLQLIGVVIFIRSLNYFFGFPTNYDEYTMFSPEVYAFNYLQRSLGDLFINLCLLFWVLLFFIINVQGEINEKKYINNPIAGTLIIIFSVGINLYLGYLVYSLVNSSVINFDTTLVSLIDVFSVVGLLSLLVIFANIYAINYITYQYIKNCFNKKFIKYVIQLIVFFFYYYFIKSIGNYCFLYVFICSAVYFFLHELRYLKIRLDFNSYSLLLWIMFISLFGSVYLSYLIEQKELLTRIDFAEKILKVEDKKLEVQLETYKAVMNEDENFDSIMHHPSKNYQQEIINYIYSDYLNMHFKRYSKKVDFILSPKYNNGFVSNYQFNKIKKFSFLKVCNIDSSLFQFQQYNEKGYLLTFPLISRKDTLGVFSCKFLKKNNYLEKNYSDYIYSNSYIDKIKEYQYSIAMYNDTTFEYRVGNYIFPFSISKKIFKNNEDKESIYINDKGNSVLWIKDDNTNKIIAVERDSNFIYLIFTLFAYIFFVYFSVLSMYILGNIIARSNLKYSRFLNFLSLNLRLRIHLAILLVVFISFLAVGYFTYYYLYNKVVNKTYSEISNYGQIFQSKISNYFSEFDTSIVKNNPNSEKIFTEFLNEESVKFSKDINIYDIHNGNIIYTTQPDFFYSKIISNKMPYDVFLKLKNENSDHILKKETINNFKYVSMYSYISNKKGEKIGILNLPYFSSEQEAKSETNTLLITLINIYVFVFIISSIIALFISNSVTKPFNFIVKQFTKINLSKTNEPLKWNSSDEIGLLVKEYNRMLRKLENSTILLAKSEREMAWREMAKQVAHEIKNPLTPMKLSIQMLEKAIKNKNPNITEMTQKVTATIIEQIDNLSLIATNFSSFAKMPELHREIINLNEILYSVTGMYNDDKNNEYLFLIPDYIIYIYADKSQLIRVFTNIIQNAIQSIPENRKGNISMIFTKISTNIIRISIIDNGEGISEEKRAKLFQPYFTTKTSGTGLGLAMCKDIIEKFGGNISFESVENEGTEFFIDLPIYDESEAL